MTDPKQTRDQKKTHIQSRKTSQRFLNYFYSTGHRKNFFHHVPGLFGSSTVLCIRSELQESGRNENHTVSLTHSTDYFLRTVHP